MGPGWLRPLLEEVGAIRAERGRRVVLILSRPPRSPARGPRLPVRRTLWTCPELLARRWRRLTADPPCSPPPTRRSGGPITPLREAVHAAPVPQASPGR